MAYQRNCRDCGQPIIMSELSPGNWQPWDSDGKKRHQCNLGKIDTPCLISQTTNAETYLTRCPWCPQHVYYHTNGNNDCVYFDNLGYPWQIHACWEEHWKEKKDRKRVRSELLKTNNFNQQKLQILAGAMQTVSTTHNQNFLVYNILERDLAQRIGLSIEDLRKVYGSLYSVEINGIKLKTISQTSNESVGASTKSCRIKIDEETGKSTIDYFPCNYCDKWFSSEQRVEHFKQVHYIRTIPDSNCGNLLSKKRLPKHVRSRKDRKRSGR